MNRLINLKLSVMMFLEFFIWGCWFVTMGTFLSQAFSSSGTEIGLAYETQSWGAIIAPFIIGLIADRYFDAEKILAIYVFNSCWVRKLFSIYINLHDTLHANSSLGKFYLL